MVSAKKEDLRHIEELDAYINYVFLHLERAVSIDELKNVLHIDKTAIKSN